MHIFSTINCIIIGRNTECIIWVHFLFLQIIDMCEIMRHGISLGFSCLPVWIHLSLIDYVKQKGAKNYFIKCNWPHLSSFIKKWSTYLIEKKKLWVYANETVTLWHITSTRICENLSYGIIKQFSIVFSPKLWTEAKLKLKNFR